jgi:Holliday junction resolvasome RuvABC ATP-dependent DNA helicase subunit
MDELTDINNCKNKITIEHENQVNNTIKRWEEYKKTLDNQITNMWNFMIYNQFNNEEIRRLHSRIIGLNKHIDNLNKDNDELYNDNRKIKKRLNNLEPPVNSQKKKKLINRLKNEYNNLSKKDKHIMSSKIFTENKKNQILRDIFSELNNIKDIINLKNNANKYNFKSDNKFIKLYNLIPCLEELNSIIGMENVKDTIFKSICYFLHGNNSNKELNHVMIRGPPGVGKTTVARIIGKIYLELGFLNNDIFKVATRADLIAKYTGQTAIKTQKVIDSVIGGVLFIDEVYSLGHKEGRDSFAKECIDTINLNMTRDEKWLLIVAGYKEDIEESFLSLNKGLERRFTVKLDINSYTSDELFDILVKFVNDDKFLLDKDAIEVKDIENIKQYLPHFGGDILKLYQKAKEFYSLRIMRESLSLETTNKLLVREDFLNAIEFIKENSNIKVEDDRYKFSMYL